MNTFNPFHRKALLFACCFVSILISALSAASDFSTALGGRVFCDKNCNGQIDVGTDEQLMNVTVQLYNSSNQLIAMQTPAQNNGIYLFTDLVPGQTYTVKVVPAFGQTAIKAVAAPLAVSQASAVVLSKTAIQLKVINQGDTYYPNDFLLSCCNMGWNQCDWGKGNSCWGSNTFKPTDLIKNSFNDIFPNGVTIGGENTITLTSVAEIQKFLPSTGTPRVLQSNKVNPGSSYGNEFAGNVLALDLNVEISDAGVTAEGYGDRILTSGKLSGTTVRDVLDMANDVLGGDLSVLPAGVSLYDLNNIIEDINENTGCDCDCDNNGKPVCVRTWDNGKCDRKKHNSCGDGRGRHRRGCH